MARIDYNDHLDDLMERLMDEDITNEDMDKTLKIAKAVTEIAKIKTDEKKIKIAQFSALNNAGLISHDLADDIKQSMGTTKKMIGNS